MKKVAIIVLASVLTLVAVAVVGTYVASASSDPTKGCVIQPGGNDGRCVTDGDTYFCKNAWPFRNCVKGSVPV